MLRWPGGGSPTPGPRRADRGAETRAADSGRGGGPRPGRSLCGVPEGYVPTRPREEDGTPGGGSACGDTRSCPAGELCLQVQLSSDKQAGSARLSVGLPAQTQTNQTPPHAQVLPAGNSCTCAGPCCTPTCRRQAGKERAATTGGTHAAGARWWTQCTPRGPPAPAGRGWYSKRRVNDGIRQKGHTCRADLQIRPAAAAAWLARARWHATPQLGAASCISSNLRNL